MENIYLLKSCNEWKEHASAKIIAATRDRHTLLVMIGGEILLGNMEYGGCEKEQAYMKFCEDLHKGIEAEWNIKYGYVETVDVISESDIATLKEKYENIRNILPYQEGVDDEELEM